MVDISGKKTFNTLGMIHVRRYPPMDYSGSSKMVYQIPNCIRIYRTNYGGYTTLAGIIKTYDLYTCSIDYVGVYNLFTFLNTIPPYWEPIRKMWYELIGDPQDPKDAEMMN
ncbi:MAG: hypothetical protein ACMUEM_00790 [Flavobacteriales bacterium AspAUS03]